MKNLLVIFVAVLAGCSVKTHNIYNMDIVGQKIVLVNKDAVLVGLTRKSSLSGPNVWQVSAINSGHECIRIKLLWNLSGFVFHAVTEYTELIPNAAKSLGYLSDEVVHYAGYSHTLKGYGRIRSIKTKPCEDNNA